MADPVTIGAMLLPTLLSFFGGGGGETRQRTEQEVPPQGWQDPMLGLFSPLLADILSRRMSSFGQGSSVYSPYASQIMEMLGGQMPKILAGAGAGGR